MAEYSRKKVTTKSVGDILKLARKRKNLSLEEVEEETKVRVRYLEALEESRYDILPATVYASGFLAKYADFLELKKDDLMANFRLERGQDLYASKLMPERKIKEPLLTVTPKTIIIVSVVVALLLIVGYIIYSVRQFTLPPNLVISSPSSEEILKEEKVNIVGKTDEGATLQINNQAVMIDGTGNFTEQVKLSAGLNTFEVKATSRLKKETVKQIKILAEF